MNQLRYALYRVGFWIRETGQGLDKLGSRLQGNFSYREESKPPWTPSLAIGTDPVEPMTGCAPCGWVPDQAVFECSQPAQDADELV
jgi:hypothetical protein